MRHRSAIAVLMALMLCACSAQTTFLRGTGDLGVIVERAAGRLKLIETSGRTELATIEGLGDLSHASVVYSRDTRYAYVFGRDGGLSKVDLLGARVVGRVVQAGNSIGGAISQDGRLIAVANYEPVASRSSTQRPWNCSPTFRPCGAMVRGAQKLSVSPMRPATALYSACSRPARYGSLT